jgi:hypothetical protein
MTSQPKGRGKEFGVSKMIKNSVMSFVDDSF